MVVSFGIESPVGRGTVRRSASALTLHEAPCSADPSALVLSGDDDSRRRIRGGLVLAGWRDHAAPIDASALDLLAKRHYQLVVVDLVHPLVAADGRPVRLAAGLVARRPGTLLVTCGDEDVADHEAWARGHAAFCHLAGAVSSVALVSVLEQAREVAERVAPA